MLLPASSSLRFVPTPFRRVPALCLLILCLVSGWQLVTHAASVQSIAKFEVNVRANALRGPDGGLYIFNGSLLRVAADGTTTTVYTPTAPDSPGLLKGPLILANDGNFYGTISHVYAGSNGLLCFGSVFRLTPTGQFSFVHEFTFGEDVGSPAFLLVQGSDGALYGTGSRTVSNTSGMVFRCTLDGQVTNLHNFEGGNGESNSRGNLTLGKDGNLYGVTGEALYQVTAAGEFRLFHTFRRSEGSYPTPGFVQDADGNFYGTATSGGGQTSSFGDGTLFRFNPAGQFTVVHTFSGEADGATPVGPLVAAADGNLYGVTSAGGTPYDGGTIYRMAPDGNVSVVYRAYNRGITLPTGGLIAGEGGTLYGVNYTDLLRVQLQSAGTFVFNTNYFVASSNAGSAFITVSRLEGASGVVSVHYATVDDTAHAGEDYTATSGVLTWADGDTSIKNIRVPLISHGELNSHSATFTVRLSNPTGDAALTGQATTDVSLTGFAGLYQTQSGMTPLFAFSRGLDGDMVQRVFAGADGNFYGTTSQGGIATGGPSSVGNTFQLTPAGDMTILASNKFLEADGLTPGADGNFYGSLADDVSPTSLYRLAPGTAPVSVRGLQSLPSTQENARDRRTLLQTRDGQFYGTLKNTDNYPAPATETIFRLNPDGTQAVLYTVEDGSDINLTEGKDGNLYGLVQRGGRYNFGFLFRLTPDAQFTRLYDFNAADGGASNPIGSLVSGADGNLYGLAATGGPGRAAGSVFRLKLKPGKTPKLKFLHGFDAKDEGVAPQGDLLVGADGNLYGTLAAASGLNPPIAFYRLSKKGELTVLYHSAPYDRPLSLLLQGPDRAFYFRTRDMDPDTILRFDPDAIGQTVVQIAGEGLARPVGSGKAFLRLSRSGDVSRPLSVRYSVEGDALAGTDYKKLSERVTFQPGHFDAAIKLKLLPTATSQRRLLITLLPEPDGTYTLVPGRDRAGFVIVTE